MKIGYLKAFTDNYIWFIQDNHNLIVVDPGEASPVLEYLKSNQLHLKAILLTHDHYDHLGGVSELLKYAEVPVYGMCHAASYLLKDNAKITLLDKIFGTVLVTPGHTNTSICYLLEINDTKHLFCGDTLFAAGCGRVFTGDFTAMFHSLNQLKALSPNFLVYPGHEYTLKNLTFAQFLEPENKIIKERIENESIKWQTLKNTLPVTIEIEKKTNPFFRCEDINLVNAVSKKIGKSVEPGLECFIQLRMLKDNF